MAPKVSIIVPVYLQWPLVEVLLAHLSRQTLAADAFEVVLVDNELAGNAIPSPLPDHVTIVDCPEPGSYAARNAGAARSVGEWLAFTDADCRPTPDWLAALLRAGAHAPDALHAGPVALVSATATPNAYEQFDMVKGIPQHRYVKRGYAATANLFVRRAVFDAVGGFDATRLSGGDAEFCRRAGSRGYPIHFVADAIVQHPARGTFAQLSTKTRRIKGGQLTKGPLRRRLGFAMQTFLPPVMSISQFLCRGGHPLRYRLTAVAVRLRLWTVEMREALRLAFGSPPDRR